ncbi:MAG: hypothetical protein WCK47_07135 [bacterium]
MPFNRTLFFVLTGIMLTLSSLPAQSAENADASSAAPLISPGIDSAIKTIYVIPHAHLDIGFTDVPSVVAAKYKTMIDAQISYCLTRSDYKWNIEETWALEQWLLRTSDTALVNQLMQLIKAGRVSVGGGHNTLHSGKASFEEMPRFLWNAARYRDKYGIAIQTVLHDDVPGVAWTYPQILAKSGIKHLICGENLFIGGGFTQPWASYPFYWQAPDGTRLLTWSTRKGYGEAFDDSAGYGLPFFTTGAVNKDRLTSSLLELTRAGYPYDALMIQYAFDNAYSTALYSAIRNWNAAYANPKFIMATPEDFFQYLEQKYSGQIAVQTGNWTTIWDTCQQIEPQGDKIIKNAHDLVPSAEKMWSFATTLGIKSYPFSQFNSAWDMILTLDEHSGAGGCWDGYWTQAQVDQNNQEFRNFTLSAQTYTSDTLETARQYLLGAAASPAQDSIIVFNPLSWPRTDLVRVPADTALLNRQFRLIDSVTDTEIPCQKDASAAMLLFVAPDVPSIGYKRFLIADGTPSPAPHSLVVGANSIENTRCRIVVNANGYISSIYDKGAARELVKQNAPVQFNCSVTATNLEYFYGFGTPVPSSAFTIISAGKNGPVAASLRITNAAHPIAATEIMLYEELDRIDIIDTPDRSQMLFAPYDMNSRYYAMAFPFNLSACIGRIDTPAGWLNPPLSSDTLQGSYTGSHTPEHCIDLSETNYGVTFATPDVYAYSFGNLQTATFSPSTPPTLYSKFIRYGDQCKLKGGSMGSVIAEPGAPARWDILFALRPHARPFDTVADTRFGMEVCTPIQPRVVAAASGAMLPAQAMSFLSVDQPNIMICGIKQANFGLGQIVKLREVSGEPLTNVVIQSQVFPFNRVTETTPLEQDIQVIFDQSAAAGAPQDDAAFTMKASEIKTLRIEYGAPYPPTEITDWTLY